MSLARLVLRSLSYYWRTHLGVVAGAAVATAILVGALAVGDSVRYSLRELSLARLGETRLAMQTGDRFYHVGLASELGEALSVRSAPAIALSASVTDGEGSRRAGNVELLGVDANFAALHDDFAPGVELGTDEIALNAPLARMLDVRVGDDVVIYADNPSSISRDLPIASEEDATTSGRLTVRHILEGSFSLLANQVAPRNALVRLEWLQDRLERRGEANLLLLGAPRDGADEPTVESATAALADHWRLADAELDLTASDDRVLLDTPRVFLDPPLADAARAVSPDALGRFGYFVNTLAAKGQATPYSMVASQAPLGGGDDLFGLQAGQIAITEWLADDLGASPGDEVTMTYYVLAPMRSLATESRTFTVAKVVPVQLDHRALLPHFPGISDIDNCRDWEIGEAVDQTRIGSEDEEYWNRYRTTPKAYVTLADARAMWGNRFGDLTGVALPTGDSPGPAGVGEALRRELAPGEVGMFFIPVRERALEASKASTDFGTLFLSLSFFLIVAALALTAMLFSFGIAQRSEQTGLLRAIGFGPWRVRLLLGAEGGALAIVGALGGLLVGPWYTQVLVWAIGSVWRGVSASSPIQYHAQPATLVLGAAIGAIVAGLAAFLTLLRQGRHSPRKLLAGQTGATPSGPLARSRWDFYAGIALLLAACACLVLTVRTPEWATGGFFAMGTLLLVSLILLGRSALGRLGAGRGPAVRTVASLALRNAGRRRGRSLATAGILAAGAFLIVAVAANRVSPAGDLDRPGSPTGGYDYWAETSVPVVRDLTDPNAWRVYNLRPSLMSGVEIAPFRLREGEDASCLNLNRAQQPRLLGAPVDRLARRGAFTFASTLIETDEPWRLLEWDGNGPVPAVADNETMLWALGKSLGETLTYVGGDGETFEVRLVGAISSSILQGSVILGADALARKFPSAEGYRVFLIDPDGQGEEVADELSVALEREGFEIAPSVDRLRAFLQVVNTYLSIFAVLGGMGLLLGSLGLGIVVLRNVLERRGELSLLRAVGFRRSRLRWMVIGEHALLCVVGVIGGAAAALIAVTPALARSGGEIPATFLAWLLAGVIVNGCLWALVATWFALRGKLLTGLRAE